MAGIGRIFHAWCGWVTAASILGQGLASPEPSTLWSSNQSVSAARQDPVPSVGTSLGTTSGVLGDSSWSGGGNLGHRTSQASAEAQPSWSWPDIPLEGSRHFAGLRSNAPGPTPWRPALGPCSGDLGCLGASSGDFARFGGCSGSAGNRGVVSGLPPCTLCSNSDMAGGCTSWRYRATAHSQLGLGQFASEALGTWQASHAGAFGPCSGDLGCLGAASGDLGRFGGCSGSAGRRGVVGAGPDGVIGAISPALSDGRAPAVASPRTSAAMSAASKAGVASQSGSGGVMVPGTTVSGSALAQAKPGTCRAPPPTTPRP